MYTGKEVCQGCGCSGSEKPRWSKTELCKECKSNIDFGIEVRKDNNPLMYKTVYAKWYKLQFYNKGDVGKELESAFISLLRTMDRPTMKADSWVDLFPYDAASGGGSDHTFKITEEQAESVKRLCTVLIEQQAAYLRKMEEIEKERKTELQRVIREERNRIYNEGIEKGRNLLFQLNAGELTTEDFNKKIDKY